jgi:E3 ubiquitin-protein ligase DOA10
MIAMLFLRSFSLSIALTIECVVLSCTATAQTRDLQTPEDQSVVDAARRSSLQKNGVARRSRVIANDDLEAPSKQKTEEHGAGAVVATQVANQTGNPTNKDLGLGDKESEAVADDVEIARLRGQVAEAERKLGLQQRELALAQQTIAVDAEMATLKDQVTEAERELNLQQRELALPQQVIYSNPRYLVNHAGQAKLDFEQQRFIESQQEINGLKERYAELQWRQWQLRQAATPDRKVQPPL